VRDLSLYLFLKRVAKLSVALQLSKYIPAVNTNKMYPSLFPHNELQIIFSVLHFFIKIWANFTSSARLLAVPRTLNSSLQAYKYARKLVNSSLLDFCSFRFFGTLA
jgi:hypothetical protein